MPTLSASQIAGIVKYSGASTGSSFASSLIHPDTDGPIFVAIALAESGGRTDARGGPNSNGTYDNGLWQINDVHKDLLSQYDWKNPTDNFRMAVILYTNRGGKFVDWSTYKNGAYAAFMTQATTAWGNPDMSKAETNAVSDAANTTYNTVSSVAGLIQALTKASTWIRVGMAVAGLVCILIAFEPLIKGKLGPIASKLGAVKDIAEVAAVA